MATHLSHRKSGRNCRMFSVVWLLMGVCATVLLSTPDRLHGQGKDAGFRLARIEGAVMLPDGKTLVVSLPSQGLLVYIDTLAGKQVKSVEMDFQPSALAVQGNHLYAVTRGAPRVHVLEATTAKPVKMIKFPGAAVKALACHPRKGLLYATNLQDEVIAIDVETGEAKRTGAKGQLIVVDPAEGKYVYTGIQKPIRDVLVVEEGPGKTFRISLASANIYALMLKYEISGTKLRLMAANDNAAANGRSMAVSADGKRIAMAGGGGYRQKGNPRANYSIAVFDTKTMKELAGQIATGAYPNGIAFHPHLKLGAAYRSGSKEVILFRDKSFIKKAEFTVSKDSVNAAGMLFFGGHGTKVIYVSTAPPPFTKQSVIEVFSLPLTDSDRAALRKIYGDK